MADNQTPTPDRQLSRRRLRDHCQSLGITPASCGMAIDELIAMSREQPDPLAWLTTFEPVAGDQGPGAGEEDPGEELGQGSDLIPDHRSSVTGTPPTLAAALESLPACSRLIDRLAANLGIADTAALEMGVELLGQVRLLDIELPLCLEAPPSGQVASWERYSQKIEVGALTTRQMSAFWALHEALDRGQFKTAGGEKIDRSRGHRPKVIRWLLDQVAQVIEAATNQEHKN